MTKKIYRARPILSLADIIFLITFTFLAVGSFLGYLFDYLGRVH